MIVFPFARNAAGCAELDEGCGVEASEAARGGAGVAWIGDGDAELWNSGKSLKSGCGVCLVCAGGESHDDCEEAVVGGGGLFTRRSLRRSAE